MTRFLVYGELASRRLTNASGSPLTLPDLVQGDSVTLALRTLDAESGTPKEVNLPVRSMKASVGVVSAPASGGNFKLAIGIAGTPTGMLTHDRDAALLAQAIGALPEAAAYGGMPTVRQAADGCWLIWFAHDGEVPLQVVDNQLDPVCFVRIRAFQQLGKWVHEVRTVQAPVAASSTHERVLAAPPSIRRIRAGQTYTEGFDTYVVNEVQALTLPSGFRGTYALQFSGRQTRMMGYLEDAVALAEALNRLSKAASASDPSFLVTVPTQDAAYIEFNGALGGQAQELLGIVVGNVDPGDLTVTLNLDTAEVAAALRTLDQYEAFLEIELELGADGEDPAHPDAGVPGTFLTFREPVKVVREMQWSGMSASAPQDWLRPPQPVSYVPFSRNQIGSGSLHFSSEFGDGLRHVYTFDHNLATEELLVAVRENTTPGRMLVVGVDYQIRFDSANSITATILGNAPQVNALLIMVQTIASRFVFLAHTHLMEDIEGLIALKNSINNRLEALEEKFPQIDPSLPSPSAIGDSILIEIPAKSEMFPCRLNASFDINSVVKSGTGLPRPRALLPACHVANPTAVDFSALPVCTEFGNVWHQSSDASPLQIPGWGGRKSASLLPGGYLGHDGRGWYGLARSGATNSYYPADFERELFMLAVNEQMLRSGTAFSLSFKLALQLFNANSRAQYLLRIDVGTAPSQSAPSPVDINLEDVQWVTTPLLLQRVILSGTRSTGLFGCSIQRNTLGELHSDVMAYGAWRAAAQQPTDANFVLRTRLLEFDTENSVPNAIGTVYYSLTDAKAEII